MVSRYLSILIWFIAANTYAQGNIVFEILDKMCAALQVDNSKRPKLEIRSTASSGASYSKINHTIYIDQKLIDAFALSREFQLNALAFVIGHELTHALEKDKHDTHFLAYDKSPGATYQDEQNADIQGAFLAYISGYNCLPVIAETIETLYSKYNLNKQIKGYPDRSDRIESVGLIREQVESLIAIFKSANLLLLSDDLELSGNLYERIFQYYPAPEVSSNIAVAHILEALNIGKYNYFRYSLPIEISWEIRLKKPNLDPGQKDFEPEILRKRDLLLKKAEIVLKQSLEFYPYSFTLWNNLICLKIIQNELPIAEKYLKEANLKFKLRNEKEQLQVMLGTIALLENNRKEALKLFKGIQSTWLNQLIDKNLNLSAPGPDAQNCIPEMTSALESSKSSLFQEKKIKLDSVTLYWSKEKIKVVTPTRNKEFDLVQVPNSGKCVPLKTLDSQGVKWNTSLISILNPLDRKQQFYSVR